MTNKFKVRYSNGNSETVVADNMRDAYSLSHPNDENGHVVSVRSKRRLSYSSRRTNYCFFG